MFKSNLYSKVKKLERFKAYLNRFKPKRFEQNYFKDRFIAMLSK